MTHEEKLLALARKGENLVREFSEIVNCKGEKSINVDKDIYSLGIFIHWQMVDEKLDMSEKKCCILSALETAYRMGMRSKEKPPTFPAEEGDSPCG